MGKSKSASATSSAAESPGTTPTGAAVKLRTPAVWDLLSTVVALVGLGIAGASAAMFHGAINGIGCDANAPETCAVIYLPSYVGHLGVPIPHIGMVGYGALLLLGVGILTARSAREAAILLSIRRVLLLGAAAATVYFVAFQIVFVGALCPICMSSAVAVAVLLGLDFSRPANAGDAREFSQSLAWKLCAMLVPAMALGTWGLSRVWEPTMAAEARKAAFLSQFEPIENFPPENAVMQQTRPSIVLVNREGCPVCADFYGTMLPNSEATLQFSDFTVYAATTASQAGVSFGGVYIDRAPTIVVFPLDAAPFRIEGFRDPVEIASVLRPLARRRGQ